MRLVSKSSRLALAAAKIPFKESRIQNVQNQNLCYRPQKTRKWILCADTWQLFVASTHDTEHIFFVGSLLDTVRI